MGKTWPLECFTNILSLSLSLSISYIFNPLLLYCLSTRPSYSWHERGELKGGFCLPPPIIPPSFLLHPCLFSISNLPKFIYPSLLSSSLHFPSVSSCHAFSLIMPTPQMLHRVNTSWDPVCLPKCFLAAG